jgi:hypothetical protein
MRSCKLQLVRGVRDSGIRGNVTGDGKVRRLNTKFGYCGSDLIPPSHEFEYEAKRVGRPSISGFQAGRRFYRWPIGHATFRIRNVTGVG